MIKLIVAMTKNGLIGKNDSLPWKIKEEINFFKEMTWNNYLLMGMNTFSSLPSSLPNRKIIVISRKKEKIGYKTIDDFNWVIKNFQSTNKSIFISGGKSIYEQFYRFADEIYISVINKNYDGNVYLKLNLSNYKKETFKIFKDFTVFKYTKK